MTSGAPLLRVDLLPGERWWGGAVADGKSMPFGDQSHRRDLRVNVGFPDDPTDGANQAAPLLISNRGRWVWSDGPFAFAVTASELVVTGGTPTLATAGGTLAEAFRAASAAHFPPTGRAPAEGMFAGPQYNTWMELPYTPTQQGVLDYVRGLLDAGFPPGAVMIDDRWSIAYGDWRFDPLAFPDPAAMVAQLHAWGCPVMLWLVPYISPDGPNFRRLEADGLLLRDPDGATAIRRWWNGFSAILDSSNPDARRWLRGGLDTLVEQYGVDGFKLDGGDFRDYLPGDIGHGTTEIAGHCRAWGEIGLSYPFNEYRSGWQRGGQPLAQRLHDKPGRWDEAGLLSLIPEGIAQGLLGYPFNCADMVGGGALGLTERSDLDQELFVRYAQVAALFPMLQFSLAPYRVLDPEPLAAVLDVVRLRQRLLPELLSWVDDAARTGEPILRPLAYDFPGDTIAEQIVDQFTLAGAVLVAPVLQKGATSRRIWFPAGRWQAADGAMHEGPAWAEIPVSLADLPWFRRVHG